MAIANQNEFPRNLCESVAGGHGAHLFAWNARVTINPELPIVGEMVLSKCRHGGHSGSHIAEKPPLPRLGCPKSSPSAFNRAWLIRKAAQATRRQAIELRAAGVCGAQRRLVVGVGAPARW